MFGSNSWKHRGLRVIAGAALFSAMGLALSSFAAKADVIVSAGADKKVKIWNPADGSEIKSITAHDGAVNAIAVSPDGKTLATGGADKKVKIWNLEKGELIKELGSHTEEVTVVSFSTDGKYLASGGADKKVKLWTIPDGKLDATLEGTNKVVGVGVLEANGMFLVLIGCSDGSIPIMGKDGNSIFTVPTDHKGGLTAMGANGKEQCVYSGGADGTFKYFSQAGQGEFEGAKHTGAVNVITTSADFEKVLTGGADGKLIVWSAADHKKLAVVDTGLKSIKSVAISADGKHIYTGGDKVAKVWDATGKELVSVDAHDGVITAILYVADKKKADDKK